MFEAVGLGAAGCTAIPVFAVAAFTSSSPGAANQRTVDRWLSASCINCVLSVGLTVNVTPAVVLDAASAGSAGAGVAPVLVPALVVVRRISRLNVPSFGLAALPNTMSMMRKRAAAAPISP